MTKRIIKLLILVFITIALLDEQPQYISNHNESNRALASSYTPSSFIVYRNYSFGFHFEYPISWNLVENDWQNGNYPPQKMRYRITLTSQVGESIEIYIWENQNNVSMNEWLDKYYRPLISNVESIPNSPNARISGNEAIIIFDKNAGFNNEVQQID